MDYKPYLIWKLNEANDWYIPKHAGYDFSSVDFYNEGKVECPCCRAVGRDNSGDNLHLYGVDENGHPLGGKCFRTELVIPSYAKAKEDYDYDMLEYNGTAIKDAKGNKVIRGESMSDVKRVSKDSVNQKKLKEKRLSEKEVQDIIENSGSDPKGFRRLTQAVCEKYGVRFQYNKQTGMTEKILFPSMVFEDGEYKTVGYKIRNFTIPKKSDGHFEAIGYVGALNTFFGQCVVQNTKNLAIVGGECFTGEAEVLTSKGFTRFDELCGDELVFAVDDSLGGDFVKPSRFLEKPFKGNLKGFKAGKFKALVTGGHKMVYLDSKGKLTKVGADVDVPESYRVPLNVEFGGSGLGLTDDEISLYLAICADSKIDVRANGNLRAHFGFRKQRKVQRLIGLLNRLNIDFTSYEDVYSDGKDYTTVNFTCPEFVKSKFIPDGWLSGASLSQKQHILSELVFWDGHTNYLERGDFKSVKCFSSKHFGEASKVQQLAVTSGMYSRMRKRESSLGIWYEVTYHSKGKHDSASLQSLSKSDEFFEGNVYCVTVDTGMILVRYKGTVYVCGNCDLLAADMMLESLKTYKSGYSVVSSLSGEPSTAECCKQNYDFVTKFSSVVLALDTDQTGKDSEKKVIEVLPNEILHTVQMAYKDPCDYWKAFKVDKKMDAVECFVQDIHWNRKVVKSFGLVGSRSLLAKAIESVIQPKIPLPAFMKDLDDYFTDGIGLGEIVNIISNTSTGKSVFVNEIITDWIVNAPYKMCILSLEDNAGSYGAKIASRMLGRKIHKIKGAENRKKILEENADVILEFLTDENGEDAFQFLEETFGSLADVKKAILQAIKVAGCKIIVIDPLVNLISNKSMEEQIDFMLFEEDCRRVHNVTFINVCHTRKIGGGAVKAASKGGEIAEEDVKGTSQITGSATINIILRRNKTADCPIIRNTTEVDITKNRSDGTTGQSCAKIFYHGNSHTLIPYSIAEENNFYQDGEKVNMNLKGITPVTTQDTPESDEDVKITKDLAAVDRTANVDFG